MTVNAAKQRKPEGTQAANNKTPLNTSRRFGSKTILIGFILPFAASLVLFKCIVGSGDVLNGFSNNVALGHFSTQLAATGFCMSGDALFDKLQAAGRKGDSHADPSDTEGAVIGDFNKSGEIREEDYAKESLYAILYGLYQAVGPVKHTNGKLYEFSFNTWGINNPGDVPYGPDEPQRHGKAAYRGLASSFEAVQKYIKGKGKNSVTFLEVGCGTGAGANLIAGEVWPEETKVYNALDMQAGGIAKCNKWGNKKLNCIHGNGQSLPLDDDSVDIVIINETHIAEISIGDEEKKIFAEIKRVLKKGGFFLWGNAIPTKVWKDGEEYLTETSSDFEACGSFDHTESAVLARQEDEPRVRLYLDQMYDKFPIFWPSVQKIVGSTQRCREVVDALLRNFFRDVGTDLYERMVTKDDSYMHKCFQVKK